MTPNWRTAVGSAGSSRSTSRYSCSALPYWSAAKYSLARDRCAALLSSCLEQPALARATSDSAHISDRDRAALRVPIGTVVVMPVAGGVGVMASHRMLD